MRHLSQSLSQKSLYVLWGVILTAVSCGAGYDTPIKVTYQRSGRGAFGRSVVLAASILNQQLGCQVFAEPKEDHVQPDGINVLYQTGASPGGQAAPRASFCSIYVADSNSDAFMLPVVIHELLHCLGQDHVDQDVNNTDVMRPAIGEEYTFGPYMKDLSALYCPGI